MKTFTRRVSSQNSVRRPAEQVFFRQDLKKIQLPISGFWHETIMALKTDRVMKLFLLGWLVPAILGLVFIAANYSSLPSQIPLFYSRIWGERQLGQSIYIYLPILGATIVGLVNVALGVVFIKNDKVLAYLLFGAAAIVSLLAAITSFNIVNLFR